METTTTEVKPDETSEMSDRARIAQGAAIIMAGTLLSRVLGLGREQITSWLFGTGDAVAAFTIADNIHTMLFNLVISGMMEAALVPVLSAYSAPEHREELRRITGALMVLALILVGGAVIVMELFAPYCGQGDDRLRRRRWRPRHQHGRSGQRDGAHHPAGRPAAGTLDDSDVDALLDAPLRPSGDLTGRCAMQPSLPSR